MWLAQRRALVSTVLFCVLMTGIIDWQIHMHTSHRYIAEKQHLYEATSGVLLELYKLLYKAHRTARSSQTKLLLEQSLGLLHKIGMVETKLASDKSRVAQPADAQMNSLPETCPEYWGDAKKEDLHPENIYVTVPCARVELEDLVEMLLHVESCSQAKHLTNRIRLVYPTISIHISVENTVHDSKLCDTLSDAIIYTNREDDASNWLALANAGQSKYILVGRNMIDFSRHTDLDRLLRVMNNLEVDIVGGAVRLEPEGLWYAGCYQAIIRNFSLRLHPGHDISAQSCAYCDYIASPFLIRRDIFNQVIAKSAMKGIMLFVEMMLSGIVRNGLRGLEVVACVDVMFHVAGHHTSRGYGVSELSKLTWVPLAKRWSLDRIILPGGVDHRWTCGDVEIKCGSFKRPGVIIPRCCLEELFQYVMMFIDAAARYNVSNYIVGGTLMGAVKMNGGILPWEKDADICWDAYMHETVSGPLANYLRNMYGVRFTKQRIATKYGTDIRACARNGEVHCVYHSIWSYNWFVELYGVPVMYSYQPEDVWNLTKVSLNGRWVTALPNPGRAIRNGYGDNILGHVQHWRDYGKPNGWTRYTNVEVEPFLSCPTGMVRHACLSGNYLPLGNIQFQDNPV